MFDISECTFRHNNNSTVSLDDIPNYLNTFFANIASTVRPSRVNDVINVNRGHREIKFEFTPPTMLELYLRC